ncbi:alpha/beta-Hydrolases superfamily protein, partial [Striga hermonthica]
MCKIIDRSPPEATKLTRVFEADSLYYNHSRSEKCFELENKTDDHGLHSWDWQACTEMVMSMAISNESMFQPSSFSYKDFSDNCKKDFGVTPRQHRITTEFGGS